MEPYSIPTKLSTQCFENVAQVHWRSEVSTTAVCNDMQAAPGTDATSVS